MNSLHFQPLVIISLSFLLGLVLTLAVRRILIRKHLFDHPNERSSHSEPVPRGGGWALLVVLVPGMALAALADGSLPQHAGVIAAVVMLALVSWFDDRKSAAGGVSAVKRLSLHIFAACLGSTAFSYDDTLFAGALPFWLDRGLMIVGWAWFMNLYNFMDGIDGITCSETIALATGACLLMTAMGLNDPFLHNLTLMLIGASLGFLVLNWHPAKIFLGDVGSVPLGFLAGFALLSLAVQGFLIPAFILPLYYVADSGITITKRALRREKIWQAHRQHFYQRATAGLGRHDKVVLWIVAANIGLICAALLATTYPLPGLGIAMAMVAILLWKMHKTSP